jgi:site-specific DNA recombinase
MSKSKSPRTYLGETGHAGSWFPGEHEPLIDRDLFEKVQDRLRTNSEGRTGRRYQTDALLTGLIFDDRGNRMSPSFSVKGGVRYRYYVSSPLVRGQKTKAGAISRIAAPPIEAEITRLVQTRIKKSDKESVKPTRELVDKLFDRITIKSDRIIVILKEDPAPVEIPWNSESKGNLTRIEHESTADQRNSPDPRLVQAIVRAHSWLQALSDGTYDSVEQLARVVDLHPKVVRSGIRLAFLAPDIVRKLLRGPAASHPKLDRPEITEQLAWSEQIRVLQHGGDFGA